MDKKFMIQLNKAAPGSNDKDLQNRSVIENVIKATCSATCSSGVARASIVLKSINSRPLSESNEVSGSGDWLAARTTWRVLQ